MMNARKIVLGGGISALSFLLYHPDAIAITEKVSKIDNPFVIIQKHPETENLMKTLDLSPDVIGVEVRPELNSEEIISRKMRKNTNTKVIGTDRIANVDEGMKREAFEISERELLDEIYVKVEDRVVFDKILSIGNKYISCKKNKISVSDKEIISTLHFLEYSKLHKTWRASGIVSKSRYYEIKNAPELRKSSIIYGKEGNIAKIFKNSIVKKIGYEYVNKTENSIEMKNSKFYGSLSPPPKNTVFIGRFATANPHYRLEDSLFVAQEGYPLCKMLTEQKRFDYYLEKRRPSRYSDRMKSLVLHTYTELSELLREIDWKENRSKKTPIKLTSILEESIDVIKLILSILAKNNYTEREIYRMFFEKSKVVWDRFLTEFYGGV